LAARLAPWQQALGAGGGGPARRPRRRGPRNRTADSPQLALNIPSTSSGSAAPSATTASDAEQAAIRPDQR
ncbi:hypothetical protein PJM48_29000, partial [Mycobacterium kansasii]